METIFGHSVGNQRGSARYEDPDSYAGEIARRIDDATDYERSHLSWEREENWQYFYGNEPVAPVTDDAGNPISRSSVVSTDVRDTVMTILPTLVRIFLGAEAPVYYTANSAENVEAAKEATNYVRYLFEHDWDGFLVLYSIFKDCLLNRAGVVRCYTETYNKVHEKTFANMHVEKLQMILMENETVEVIEMSDMDQETGLIEEVTLRYMIHEPQTMIRGVKPEDFRISRYATTAKSADLIGEQRMVPISDFVKEGYNYDEIAEYAGGDYYVTEEAFLREPAMSDHWSNTPGVLRGEYYIRIDGDGDGIDELRYIKTIGDNHHILEDRIAEASDFAVFLSDIRPHTALGDALADLAKDIQKIKTNVLRNTLDNMVEVINPKMVINELLVNIEDALNDEVGAVIRTRGDAATSVSYSRPEFVGAEAKVIMDYLDQIRASRTGITEASKGLDPAAMQSTALAGIDAIISGAQERIELIARCIANTGFRSLFQIALREITENPAPKRQVELCGKWVYVDPSLYDPTMKVQTNPTLGKGTDQIRLQVLNMVAEYQKEIMGKFGIRNPVVGPDEYLNTIEDALSIVNIRDMSRYFKRMNEEQLKQMMETPEEPSPEQVVAKAQMEEVRSKTAKALGDQQIKDKQLEFQREKLAVDDDFRRDKLNVDAAVAAVQATGDANTQLDDQEKLKQDNQKDAA